MALVTTDTCQIYWNYQVWTLPKGTVVPDGEFATYLRSAGGAPVKEVEGGGEGVPNGSAKDVLGWVGDDPARAALALRAENERDKPRSTLVTDLEKVTQ